MAQVKFGTFAKRRNSTKQPTSLSDTRTVTLKETTSQDRPTFIVTGNNFNYNYCEWDGKYYFIEDIESLRNNEIAVHCILDPLATYKTEILASTQFVCYSSVLGDTWLMDSRIPILSKGSAHKTTIVNPRLSRSGSYVLAVNGENGCAIYRISQANISQLIQNLTTWQSNVTSSFLNGLLSPGGDIVVATENLYTVLARAGAFGNAYSDAPAQIKSCIWVPFDAATFTIVNSNKQIYLGQFDTGVYADEVSATPYMDSFTFTIPWTYNDWRRSKCEDLYMYLPLVGLCSIESENIAANTTMTIDYSMMPTDGSIAYEIKCGNQIIGSYGASCSANYPIGISQQASAGEIINSVLSGLDKAVSVAVSSSVSPVSVGAAAAGMALTAVEAGYDTAYTSNTRHNTTIGGVGGGVGAGLDLSATLFDVVHDTVINPSAMAATMGLPTMKPLTLSSCTGYCQCANAHVEAPATAAELDAIDAMLNSGFYIE